MSSRCDQCGGRLRRGGHATFTRTLCDRCFEQFQGQAAGLIVHGTVEGAIATGGWYERLRARRRKG